MKLNMDFYSNYEVSITQTLDGPYQQLDEEFRSLLLFSTFLTRVYSNFGSHPIAKVLSCILRRFDQNDYQLLLNGRYVLPKPDRLTQWADQDNMDPGVDLDVLVRMIFQPMLKMVASHSSKGKHSFNLSLSPCKLDLKGFNMFSRDLNYYLFQSVFPAIFNVGKFYQYLGCPSDNIGFATNYISLYYQKAGSQDFFNSEGFAQAIIMKFMTHDID